MISKITVLHTKSNLSDPIVTQISQRATTDRRISIIPFERVARYINPAPWPVLLESKYPNGITEEFDNAFVVNRLLDFNSDLLHAGMLRYANHELWLHVALNPLLARAKHLAHEPGGRGVTRAMLPLNSQWLLIGQNSKIDVPRFVYGFGAEEPDISGLDDPMQKSIWSLFDWKTENHLSERERGWHKFFVEKPRGIPVITHFLGHIVWHTFPREKPDQNVIDELKVLSQAVRTIFRSDIGEFLAYHDQARTTFYAFSPYLKSAESHPDLADKTDEWLHSLLGRLTPA